MDTTQRKRIGVFGGAFDPVHDQHIRIIELALQQLQLDKVVVVPSAHAPHKLTATSFEDRVQMLRLALRGQPDVIVDTLEAELQGTTYSAVVLPLLSAKYGSIIHIIGGDSLVDMPTWYHPQDVMRFAHAVVYRGAPDEKQLRALDNARLQYNANITPLTMWCDPVSSTEIRNRYLAGMHPDNVPPAVDEYIARHGLYARYDALVREVPRHITPERWAHTQQVALMACRLNTQLGLDGDKVWTAALLHDCAKSLTDPLPDVPVDCRQPAVVHAFNGAILAERDYGVQDEDVLNAIRYHTTGRAAMSRLEQLIYLADYCEETRTFAGADEVRQLALRDFDAAFRLAVNKVWQHLLESKRTVCPLGKMCYQYYCL